MSRIEAGMGIAMPKSLRRWRKGRMKVRYSVGSMLGNDSEVVKVRPDISEDCVWRMKS